MKIAVFDTHKFERPVFEELNQGFGHEITYFEPRLTVETAKLANGFSCVCLFTNDCVNASVLEKLKQEGVQLIALRSAGFNHVDIPAAVKLGLKVVRVPAYSPHAVAEHAVAMIMSLNRKICRASARVHDLNFSLDGLVGFDLFGKTVGIIGTGRIGSVMAKIMAGFGCRVLAFDQAPNPGLVEDLGVKYVSLDELYRLSDIITLHIPFTPAMKHLLNAAAFEKMKKGVMIINTGRGALIDAKDLIDALKRSQVGFAGLDVYEEEENVFFQDFSEKVLQDDVLARLMTFPNVLITAHQAFLTREALHNIVQTTLQNVRTFESGRPLLNEVKI